MFSLVRLSSTCRSSLCLVRSLSSLAAERTSLLSKIYAPFANLDKGSPEYEKLALSGKVWEDYYQPGDSERCGYVKLQQLHTPILHEIDSLKESMKSPMSTIVESLIAEYAHQSVQIEDNNLKLGESIQIKDHLASTLFKKIDLASTSVSELSQTGLPDVHYLLPHADASQVAELRNHIVASHWVTETALQNAGTVGLDEDNIRHLSAIVIKGTDAGAFYTLGWGKRVMPGEYRQASIAVKSNPLRVFPYHVEVPALMQRFFQWREEANHKKDLHPLILACQAIALIMQDYMIRQGYVPAIFQRLERQDYLRMIKDVQDGDPSEFVAQVLTTQLEEMQTFRMREF